MKKAVLLSTLCLLILAAATSSALAETLGFGFVNNTDVALRRGIGGKTIPAIIREVQSKLQA